MAKRHRILVVIDPTSEEQPALAKAADFAGHIDAAPNGRPNVPKCDLEPVDGSLCCPAFSHGSVPP